MNRLVPALLALTACVLLVIVQANVPWAMVRQGGSNAHVDRTVTTWQDQRTMGFGGMSSGQSKGWFEGGWDDSETAAVAKLRVAAPLLTGAALLLLVGGLVLLLVPSIVGGLVVLVGAVATVVGTVLFSIASQDLLGGSESWRAGFFLAIASCVLGLVAGTIGFVAGSGRTSAETPQA